MTVFFTVFWIFVVVSITLFIYINGGSISPKGAEFIARGREAGLTPHEIKMLKKTADILEMDKPLTLLGSVANIDRAIIKLNNLLEESDFKDYDIIDLLEELYKYRKQIEMEKIERRTSISTSRDIDVNQQVKITIGNMEIPILGVITENNPNYLNISLTRETSVKPGVNWDGPVNVFFWRKNDAGYFFEALVSEKSSSTDWKLSHSTELIRSQKREDLRIDLEQNAYIYKLSDISKKNSRSEGFTGIFAQIKNISEGGLAFLINGKVTKGLPLKVEFLLNEKIVVVCGVVKDYSHNSINNISTVRLRFIEPDFQMLTQIRSYLYTSSREIFENQENKNSKNIENNEEINNNNSEEVEDTEIEDITEVEYLSENSNVLN